MYLKLIAKAKILNSLMNKLLYGDLIFDEKRIIFLNNY